MTLSRTARIVLRCLTVVGLMVIYAPLALVVVNSFNANRTFAWPPRDLTLEWWRRAATNFPSSERRSWTPASLSREQL